MSKAINEKNKIYSTALLDKAVTHVKTLYDPSDDGITDIHVSYDGTWHKRGHTSKTGMGCVIETKSGLVVDYEVLTTYCPTCAMTGERFKKEKPGKIRRLVPFSSAPLSEEL